MKASLQQDFSIAAAEMARPCVVFKPTLSMDGDVWCVLLGEHIASGLAAFGKTPAEAMTNFDQAFYKERTPGFYALEAKRQEQADNSQFGVGA
jgi:hypothetical protein